MNRAAWRFILVVAVLAAIAAGLGNLGRPLANPDEGRYSEISREMAASGDWITPRLNGIKYFEKPPLQYWATAAAFRVFGENEYSARLYVTLAGLATLLVVGFTGLRLYRPEVGVASMLALAASPYFMAMGGIVTLDIGLTLWTTAAICAYLIAEVAAADQRARARWMLAAWAAMALAVLSKGLIGIVLPAAALVLHCLARRDFSPIARLQWSYGLAVFFAIAAPWFAAVSLANPEFAHFFFVHEHFERFLTTSHRRTEPWWYFLPILAVGFLPWMFALPAALSHAWRADGRTRGAQPLRLAIVFAAFLVAFFSLSGSKLPAYILPAFPPLALVLGLYLVEAPTRRLALWLAPVPFIAMALAWLAWRLPSGARDAWTRGLYEQAMPWALTGAAALLAAAIAALWLMSRGRRWAAVALVCAGSVLMVDRLEDAYGKLSPRQSGAAVAAKMRHLLGPATRLYSVGTYEQTIPFYVGRTMTLVSYADEFEPGLRSEPGRRIETLGEFPAFWLRPGDALAIMHPDTHDALKAQGLPMQVLHQDPRRVLVRKP